MKVKGSEWREIVVSDKGLEILFQWSVVTYVWKDNRRPLEQRA